MRSTEGKKEDLCTGAVVCQCSAKKKEGDQQRPAMITS